MTTELVRPADLPRVDARRCEAIERFWRTANYLTTGLLYLRANPVLRRGLRYSDVKPRAVGHWGCAPGVNFIWGNLLAAIKHTAADVRLFVGTGHAGAAWLACTSLEGSHGGTSDPLGDEESLGAWFAAFGRSGGLPTELSPSSPGVMWASGEIGHALAIAQGHAMSTTDAQTVAVLGDGELETAPTAAALQYLATPRRRLPLTIIVNHNGLKMGGPTASAAWDDEKLRNLFAPVDPQCIVVRGFNADSLCPALETALSLDRPSVVVLRTDKGATAPPLGELDIVATVRAHKAPLKHISNDNELAWLERWLRSYEPQELFTSDRGGFDRRTLDPLLPPTNLLPGNVAQRIPPRSHAQSPVPNVAGRRADTPSATFAVAVRAEAQSGAGALVTSPDELASNGLSDLNSPNIAVVEHLSEDLCAAWAIGAAAAGRPTWFTTYEAFAPIAGSLLAQYVKYLDAGTHDPLPIAGSVTVLLTSLGWRNVYSHRNPSLVSSLIEARPHSLRCYLPTTAAAMQAAVHSAATTPRTLSCIVADKHHRYPPSPGQATAPTVSPFSFLASDTAYDNDTTRLVLFVAGDYLVREAVFAAQAATALNTNVQVDVCRLEELTWLYRDDQPSAAHREVLDQAMHRCERALLATALHGPTLGQLLSDVLPPGCTLTIRGFRDDPTAATGVGLLLAARCTWPQLAHDLVVLANRADPATTTAVKQLAELERQLVADTADAYDDPAWYWRSEPTPVLEQRRNTR